VCEIVSRDSPIFSATYSNPLYQSPVGEQTKTSHEGQDCLSVCEDEFCCSLALASSSLSKDVEEVMMEGADHFRIDLEPIRLFVPVF
jgi:hypothetical protein